METLANAFRTRRILRPVGMNNPFGRSGTWACAFCRSWKRKVIDSSSQFADIYEQCMYTSFKAVCELCCLKNRKEPCIKITAAEYHPSRVPQSPNGATRTDNEQMLLEYIHSDEFFQRRPVDSDYLAMLVNVFGQLHRPIGLRHSIYTFATVYYPHKPVQDKFEYHKRLALRTLARKLRSTETIDDEDVYGCQLLLSSVMSYNCWDEDIKVIAALFVSLYRRYHEASHSKSEIFVKLIPSILDFVVKTLSRSKIRLPSALSEILQNWPTNFSQRVTYQEFYRRASRTPDVWQDELVEAVSLTAARSVSLLLYCLRDVVVHEMIFDFKRNNLVENILKCVGSDLTDPEFLKAFEMMDTFENNLTTTRQKLGMFVCIDTRCARLLLKLLTTRTVMEGLCDPTLAWDSAELIKRAIGWWDCYNLEFPFKFNTGISRRSRVQVVVGGCVCPERLSKFRIHWILLMLC
jgi:hypothetical protein